MEGIEAVKEALEERNNPDVPTDFLLKLLELIFKFNIFEFNSELFFQLIGTAMGTKPAPSYANIFMARRIDNKIELNNIHPTIKFTMNHIFPENSPEMENPVPPCPCPPAQSLAFLDTACSVRSGQIVRYDLDLHIQYDLDLHILSTHNPVTTTPVSRNSHVIKLEEKTSLDRLASICVLENFANAIPNLHQCKVCGFSARDEAHLKIHDVRNHASSQIKKPLLQCEFCPFTTSTNLQLHKHTSTNHAKIRCDQCLFTTSSQFTLDLHIVQEHDPSKSTSCPPPLYPCNLCGITFNLEEDLKNHILRRHVPVPDPHSPYQQVTPTTHPQSHFQMNDTLARNLEEQLDLAQTLKQFKDSVNAQLHVVQEDQKDLRKAIHKLSNDSAQLNGSTSFDLKILESNLQHHISNLSSFMHKSS